MQGKSLVFLSYFLNCTIDELEQTNALIQLAAEIQLPQGAERVLAECMTDRETAELVNQLTIKRRESYSTPRGVWTKGKKRTEILEISRAKREAEETARRERKQWERRGRKPKQATAL